MTLIDTIKSLLPDLQFTEGNMTIIVVVQSRPFKVQTYQKSKAVWIASGEYRGEMLAGRGQSEGEAIKRWKEAAINRGG
jgi:hypothetical protein